MKLSLSFIKEKLCKDDSSYIQKIVHLKLSDFYTENCYIFDVSFLETDTSTLLFCFPEQCYSESVLEAVCANKNIGLIWINEKKEPPHKVNVLWIKDEKTPWIIFNRIEAIFRYFNNWEKKVYELIWHRKPFEEIFSCLDEVTDNPWYFADSSFRILVIKKDADLEEMSVIWRYMCRHDHLPLYSIINLVETDELTIMNSHKKAFLVSKITTFNVPFINKTIFSDKGILGHFFILGVYTKLTAYEVEIAEFFGNALMQLLQDYNYMPTLGRIYDNYFTDLIEGIPKETLPLTDKIFHILSWESEDIFVLFLMTLPDKDSSTENILKTEIHILEYNYPCKAFFYQDKLACVFNATQFKEKSLEMDYSFLEKILKQIASNFRRQIGVSDFFTGIEGFSHLNVYYQQAYSALNYCRKEIKNNVCYYHTIAISDFCNRLSGQLPLQMIFHDAIRILKNYDLENGTELITSLQRYLENGQNTTHTAKELFIHRNTLLYRLDTIKELTNLDLNDPDIRFRLMLSFYLYESLYPLDDE